jgi:hypothetical protein
MGSHRKLMILYEKIAALESIASTGKGKTYLGTRRQIQCLVYERVWHQETMVECQMLGTWIDCKHKDTCAGGDFEVTVPHELRCLPCAQGTAMTKGAYLYKLDCICVEVPVHHTCFRIGFVALNSRSLQNGVPSTTRTPL